MTDYKNLKLIATSNPHIRSNDTTRSIMLDVIIAMLPALIWSVVEFGVRAIAVTLVSVAGSVFFEWLYRNILKKPQSVGDLSAVVTGMLLAFVCPVNVAYWQILIGDAFAIIMVKQLFGGIGKNFANPALVGRIVLFLSFSKTMTAWVFPDAVSSATPLAQLAAGQKPELWTLLLGNHGGCIGETCALALLLGGAYLLLRGVITWQTPVCFVGTVFVLSLILGQDAMRQILSGGLLLGAFFMATDYVTAPQTCWGRALFGIGAGLLTCLIRFYGSYAEGVSFAILFMNILTPYLSKWTKSKPLGGVPA